MDSIKIFVQFFIELISQLKGLLLFVQPITVIERRLPICWIYLWNTATHNEAMAAVAYGLVPSALQASGGGGCFKIAISNIDYGKTFFQLILFYLFHFENILCRNLFQYFKLRLLIRIQFHRNKNIICIISFIFQRGTAFLAIPGKPPLMYYYSENQFEIRIVHIRMQRFIFVLRPINTYGI